MAGVKTSSAKAKGRTLQKLACSALLKLGSAYGLKPGDIRSCSMGSNGLDVILSPRAEEVLGRIAIECKNKENLNVITTFWEHAAKYKGYLPLLVHKKNYTEPLITLKFSDFMVLLAGSIHLAHGSE